jgi:hypothetical protein
LHNNQNSNVNWTEKKKNDIKIAITAIVGVILIFFGRSSAAEH